MRRALEIMLEFLRANEQPHSECRRVVEGYAHVLSMLGTPPGHVQERINGLAALHGCRIHFTQNETGS
jgi:hypothetical protein